MTTSEARGEQRQQAGLRDGLRINIFGFGLSAVWTPLNTLILPDRAAATVSDGLKGSGVGLITFIGIGIAAFVQPPAGAVSDRAPFHDRRRPFILYPAIAVAILLVAVGIAPSFLLLLAAYVLLQIASNIAQASFQALIPDLVEEGDRGDASAAKTALGFIGTAVGLIGVAAIVVLGGNAVACVALAVLLLAVLGLHLRWVPRVPPASDERRAKNLRDLFSRETALTPFRHVAHMPAPFRTAVTMRFAFLLGLYPLQRFLFYFLEDRFGIEEPVGGVAIGMLVGIALAGVGAAATSTIEDVVGRERMIRVAIVVAAGAMLALAYAPTLTFVMVAGLVLAVSVGIFQAANWELLTDAVPEEEGAAYMGLANVATAGASALAGLLGPVVDAANALVPGGTYQITFTLAALVTLVALRWVRQEEGAPSHEPRATEAG